MRRISWRALLVAGTLACNAVDPASAPPQSLVGLEPPIAPYEAIDLGVLPGMTGSEATDINASGQVVGWSFGGSGAGAFLWEDGILRDLGSLGGGWSFAHAINDGGQVVGLSRTADGRYHTFLWTDGIMLDLEPNAAVTDRFLAPHTRINNTGHVAFTGIIDWNTTVWKRRAYLWRDGVLTDLGTLGGTLTSSQVAGINDRDQVVGTSTNPTFSGGNAFIWDQGTLRDLGSLGGTGTASAVDINNRGQVVGNSNGRAVLWDNGQITDLGVLPGDQVSAAIAINEAGQVTGNSLFDRFEPGHAFRWQSGVLAPLSVTYQADPPQLVFTANERGLAAGYWRSDGEWPRAVAWEAGVTWVLGPPDLFSRAIAMNDRGDVAGFVWDPNIGSTQRAVLWRRTDAVATALP